MRSIAYARLMAVAVVIAALANPGIAVAQQSHTVTVVDGTVENVVFTAPEEATEWEWSLTVNAGTGWEHIVPSQQPNHAPWLPTFDAASGYWRVTVTPGSPEQHFQIQFSGALRPVGEGGAGEGEPVVGEWQIDGKTDSEYFVLPELTYAPVGRTVTLRAEDEDGNPVASHWTVSPTAGVTPAVLPDGATVSFTSTAFGKYIVKGTSLVDQEHTDSAHVSFYSADFITRCSEALSLELHDSREAVITISLHGEVDPNVPGFSWSAEPAEKEENGRTIINNAGTDVAFSPTDDPLKWRTSKMFWYGINPDRCCFECLHAYTFTLTMDDTVVVRRDSRVAFFKEDPRSFLAIAPAEPPATISLPEFDAATGQYRCEVQFGGFQKSAFSTGLPVRNQYETEAAAEEAYHCSQLRGAVPSESGGQGDCFTEKGFWFCMGLPAEGPHYVYGATPEDALREANESVRIALNDEKGLSSGILGRTKPDGTEIYGLDHGFMEITAKARVNYNAAFKYHCTYEQTYGPNPINHVHPAFQ